jgi:low affinity Fe/Cu permease
MELDVAEELGRCVVGFIQNKAEVDIDRIDPKDLEAVKRLRTRLGERHLAEFTTPEELRTEMIKALARYRQDEVRTTSLKASEPTVIRDVARDLPNDEE